MKCGRTRWRGSKGGSFRTGFGRSHRSFYPNPPGSEPPWSHWESADECDFISNGHAPSHFRRPGIGLGSWLGLKPQVLEPVHNLEPDLTSQGRAFREGKWVSAVGPTLRAGSARRVATAVGFKVFPWKPCQQQCSPPGLAGKESQRALSSALSQRHWRCLEDSWPSGPRKDHAQAGETWGVAPQPQGAKEAFASQPGHQFAKDLEEVISPSWVLIPHL